MTDTFKFKMDALVAFWMLLSITIYLTITTGIKMYKQLIYDKHRIIQNFCKSIEQNDIVTCTNIVRKHPQYINAYNNDGYTPFLIACANGNTALVTLMLNRGANVKLKSLQQESPFYLAAFYFVKHPQYKNATCIRQLYYAGADIDEPNAHGITPLQMAAMFGNKGLVKWLLVKNASVTVNPNPYQIAIYQGHSETAQIIWVKLNFPTVEHRRF